MSNLTIYHGTSARFKDQIAEEGIKPRKESGHTGNWSQAPSRADFVYLTDTYPIYFAFSALEEMEMEELEDENLMIYKLSIPTDNLYPDEDFIFHVFRKRGVDLSNQKCKEYALSNQELWEDSLNLLGTVGHRGSISPSQIVEQVELSVKEDLFTIWEGVQPTITIENKQLCGVRYQELVSNLF